MNIPDNHSKTYTVSAILKVGPYIYSEFFRLTLDEIKDKFESWNRNNHQIIRVSLTFDDDDSNEPEYFRVKDYNDLCWVIEHKDDTLFKYFKEYRQRD